MINKKRYRIRIIVPTFPPFNIYKRIARATTALGAVCVATSANKLTGWDVEVIDENNCRHKLCPKDKESLPDHVQLQKDRPADVVGFYGSLSSTIPRIFKLASLYKQLGVKTIAGGKHIENLPQEALANNIDVVVFGEGEKAIREILLAWQNKESLDNIKGIAFQRDGLMIKTEERPLITDLDELPFPDFNLIRYARIKLYPVSRILGCNMNCEFCAVKDRVRCASPQKMIANIAHLVETQKAKWFFETSDHFAANREEAIEFCGLLADYQKKTGVKIRMTVQIRLNDALYPELLEAMRRAGMNNVCIGYESPIDEELKAMRKGYLSRDMIEWTNIFHQFGFFIHGMFIFGYPQKNSPAGKEAEPIIPIAEKVKKFQNFIKKAKVDTVQVLLTVPLPGTDLRKRLEKENRLYHLKEIGWEYYDGQFPLFEPDNGVSPEELQQAVGKIMSSFYGFHHLWRLILSYVFEFPLIVFPAVLTLTTLRARYLTAAYRWWNKYCLRNLKLRFGGYFIVRGWFKQFKEDGFLEKLARAKKKLKVNLV